MSRLKAARWRIEAGALALVFRGFGALPIDAASALGGWLARVLGPLFKPHRIARRNLTRAFPEKSPAEIAAILRGMWDNLGRTAAEYPHLPALLPGGGRVELQGIAPVDALRAAGRPVIFFSAHFGNWEICAPAAAVIGLPNLAINREANNPLAEAVIERMRAAVPGRRIGKGARAARAILAAVKQNVSLAMLTDQKMNDGIAVPFFGRVAMTAPAIAELALRHDLAIVPARALRLHGARFRLVVDEPIRLAATGDRQADVAAAMTRINAIIEGWVRADPEQWFWVHRRWPD